MRFDDGGVQWATVVIRDKPTPSGDIRKFSNELLSVLAEVIPVKATPETEFSFESTSQALVGMKEFLVQWRARYKKHKFVFIVSTESHCVNEPKKKYHEFFLEKYGYDINFFSTSYRKMVDLIKNNERGVVEVFRSFCHVPEVYAANRQRLRERERMGDRPTPPATPPSQQPKAPPPQPAQSQTQSHIYQNRHGMWEGTIQVHGAQSAVVTTQSGVQFKVAQGPEETGPANYVQRFKQGERVVFSVVRNLAVSVTPATLMKQGKGTVLKVYPNYFFLMSPLCPNNIFVPLHKVSCLLSADMPQSCHAIVKIGEKVLYRAIPAVKVGCYRALEVRPINALQQLYEQKCAQSMASKNTNNNASNYSTSTNSDTPIQPISNQYCPDTWPDAASSVNNSIDIPIQRDPFDSPNNKKNRQQTTTIQSPKKIGGIDGLAAESVDAQTIVNDLELFFRQYETGGGDHFVLENDNAVEEEVFDADFEDELNRELEAAFGYIESQSNYSDTAGSLSTAPGPEISEQNTDYSQLIFAGSGSHSGRSSSNRAASPSHPASSGVSEAAYDKNPAGTSESSDYGQLPPEFQDQLKRIQQKAQQELAKTELKLNVKQIEEDSTPMQQMDIPETPPGLFPSQNNMSAQSSSLQEHYEETMASALPPPGFSSPIVPETQPQSNQDPLPTLPSPQLPYTPPSIAEQSLKERVDWLQSEVEQGSEWLFEAGVVLEYAQLQTHTHEMFPELGLALFADHL